jgi:hypothetical protein
MKTPDTTINHNATINQSRVRLLLTLAGIVTAVLCSIALRYDGPSALRMDVGLPHLFDTSKIVAAGLFGDV